MSERIVLYNSSTGNNLLHYLSDVSVCILDPSSFRGYIPTMTSDSTPYPFVAKWYANSDPVDAYKAFDNDASTYTVATGATNQAIILNITLDTSISIRSAKIVFSYLTSYEYLAYPDPGPPPYPWITYYTAAHVSICSTPNGLPPSQSIPGFGSPYWIDPKDVVIWNKTYGVEYENNNPIPFTKRILEIITLDTPSKGSKNYYFHIVLSHSGFPVGYPHVLPRNIYVEEFQIFK